MVVASVALFLALGGSVYAASLIDGSSIKLKSLPGNRLAPGSVPANRLEPGAIPGSRLAPRSITGQQIDVATLGQVPSAVHADNADSAHDAETALKAVTAIDAEKIGGLSAGCTVDARPFAGACWQTASSEAAVTATAAAASCATQGGELPDPLALVAFSQQPGIALAVGDEWSADVTNVSGKDVYAVSTVSRTGNVNAVPFSEPRKYRCVMPLVS